MCFTTCGSVRMVCSHDLATAADDAASRPCRTECPTMTWPWPLVSGEEQKRIRGHGRGNLSNSIRQVRI